MSKEIVSVVERVNQAFAAGDVEGFLSLCTEDVVFTMIGDRRVEGKAAIREWMAGSEETLPKFSVETIIASEDRAVCYGDMTMKEKDGTGSYEYCDVYRIQNGKVNELRAYVIKLGVAGNVGG